MSSLLKKLGWNFLIIQWTLVCEKIKRNKTVKNISKCQVYTLNTEHVFIKIRHNGIFILKIIYADIGWNQNIICDKMI